MPPEIVLGLFGASSLISMAAIATPKAPTRRYSKGCTCFYCVTAKPQWCIYR